MKENKQFPILANILLCTKHALSSIAGKKEKIIDSKEYPGTILMDLTKAYNKIIRIRLQLKRNYYSFKSPIK